MLFSSLSCFIGLGKGFLHFNIEVKLSIYLLFYLTHSLSYSKGNFK